MGARGARPLVPTFEGFVQNSVDGLILFEACLSGNLHHIPRRPYARERDTLIKSGNIFIYDEKASGIKRWTDGVAWSPSRISGNFLIYRELEKPFSPGQGRRATKRKRPSLLDGELASRDAHDCLHDLGVAKLITPPKPTLPADIESDLPTKNWNKELERSLVGSLVDSYDFRVGGLIKKTMTISMNGVPHHMVSYYRVDDVKYNGLGRPVQDLRFQHITIRHELCFKQNFRVPIKEMERQAAIPGQMHSQTQITCSSVDMGGQAVGCKRYSDEHCLQAYALTPTTGVHRTRFRSDMLDTQSAHPSTSTSAAYLDRATWSVRSDYKYGLQAFSAPEFESTTQEISYSNPHLVSCSDIQGESSYSSAGTLLQSCYATCIQSKSPPFDPMSAYTDRHSYGGTGTSAIVNGQTLQL
jgi:hypothetical protein